MPTESVCCLRTPMRIFCGWWKRQTFEQRALRKLNKIMATIQDVKDDVEAIKAAAVNADAQMDLMIGLIADLKNQLASGTGVTQEDLDSLRAGLDEAKAWLASVDAKEVAAVS